MEAWRRGAWAPRGARAWGNRVADPPLFRGSDPLFAAWRWGIASPPPRADPRWRPKAGQRGRLGVYEESTAALLVREAAREADRPPFVAHTACRPERPPPVSASPLHSHDEDPQHDDLTTESATHAGVATVVGGSRPAVPGMGSAVLFSPRGAGSARRGVSKTLEVREQRRVPDEVSSGRRRRVSGYSSVATPRMRACAASKRAPIEMASPVPSSSTSMSRSMGRATTTVSQ